MDLAARTHRQLLAIVAVIVAVTLAGMTMLWPSVDELPESEDMPVDETMAGGLIREVVIIQGEPDEFFGGSGEVAILAVEVTDGPDAGEVVRIETPTDAYPPFDPGDRVELARSEVPGEEAEYYVVDFQRLGSLGWLLALFVVTVVAVSRWQGLRSLIGLGISLLIITRFVVPGILAGSNPLLIALVGAMAVMVVTLYLSHGVSEMTTSAVIGTAAALAVTIGLALVFIESTQLSGFSSEDATFARFVVPGLDLRGLILAGLIIAALGVLDDVTVSQASTVFALHDADPTQS